MATNVKLDDGRSAQLTILSGVETPSGESAGLTVTTQMPPSDASDNTLPFGTEVTVTTALTKVAEIAGSGLLRIDVSGLALDQFEIRGVTAGGEVTLANAPADYAETTMVGILKGASGDLTNLGVGDGWLIFEPSANRYAIYAASSGASSGVTFNV